MKKILALLMALAMVFSLTACGGSGEKETEATQATEATKATETATQATEATEESGTKVVVDVLGREVTVPSAVTRIAALGNAPRQLVYMGLADKIVGISEGYTAGNFSPIAAFGYVNNDAWAQLPAVGTGDAECYFEQLMIVAPDVLICTFPADVADDVQNKTGVPVVCIQTGTLFGEDYDASWRLIGEVCGAEERAEELIKYIDDCLADIANRTKDIPEDQRPTCLSAAASFKGAHGIEGVRLKDAVLTAVNANSVAKLEGSNAGSAEVGKEQIMAWNPQYIFCDASNVYLVTEDEDANPEFYEQLDAYNNNTIYQHPNGTYNYSNVEMPLANAYFIASILYPDQFADIDYEVKANEIFKFFLGVDNYLAELEAVGAGYGVVDFGNE